MDIFSLFSYLVVRQDKGRSLWDNSMPYYYPDLPFIPSYLLIVKGFLCPTIIVVYISEYHLSLVSHSEKDKPRHIPCIIAQELR